MYWFNPVSILLNELLSGATIALPAQVNTILELIRIASHLMFGFFLTGLCMNFVAIFVAPITLYSRWWEVPFAILSFVASLLATLAALIATAMFVIFKDVVTSQSELNIGASLGTSMFVFMWLGAFFSIFGWWVHLFFGCCCCCFSRRNVSTSREARNEMRGDEKKERKKKVWLGVRRLARTKGESETV